MTMLQLKELGLTPTEVEKISYLAKLFKCQKMTVEEIKILDKAPQ
jgi:hypothetical protein